MKLYTNQELKTYLSVIESMIKKCEKAQLNITKDSAQATLLINRINALNIVKFVMSNTFVSYSEND